MPRIIMPLASFRRNLASWVLGSAFSTTLSQFAGIIQKRKYLVQSRLQPDELAGKPDNQANDSTDIIKKQVISTFELSPTQYFLFILKASFISTFGFDGLNHSTAMITSADGKETPYDGESLPLWVIITSLLGLPNRPSSVVDGVPQYTVAQFFRNFIGGWNPVFINSNKALSREKIIWQFLAIPFKVLLILPIKLVSIPFKILLNAVKLVTEFLLPLVSHYLAKANAWMIVGILNLADLAVVHTKTYGEDHFITTSSKVSTRRAILLAIPLAILTVLTAAVAVVQYATVLACRMGVALTSPAKSAQIAFAQGQNLDIGFPIISNIMGVLGALVSLTLSAVLWTMALPLALGALVTAIPSVLTAITWVSQVPFIATSLAWLSSTSLVTGSMTLLNGLFGTVGTALAAAFGPAIGALATVISVQIPAIAITVGATLGLLVTPVAALLSLGADKLSDLWATWIESGPIGWIASFKSKGSLVGETELKPLPTPAPPKKDNVVVALSTKPQHILGQPSNTPTEPTVYLYEDKTKGPAKVVNRGIVISRQTLDLVEKNKHLLYKTAVCGPMAEECLRKAEGGSYLVSRDGLELEYTLRFPTHEEKMPVLTEPEVPSHTTAPRPGGDSDDFN